MKKASLSDKKNQYIFAVGIPSYQEADSIRFVLNRVDQGICKYFDPKKSIIINLDSDSPDNTKKAFLQTRTKTHKKYMKTPRGKGRAMFQFMKYCLKNNITYIATVDADLKTITPEWIYHLIGPITHGYDYVIPVYTRNRFEANITNNFAYPILFSTFGIELRQPLGGEFGYSQRFCQYLLNQPKYLKTYEYGVDIFISACALGGNFKIKEVFLGKKIHAPSFYHMESTFRQVFESGLFITRYYRKNGFHINKLNKNKKSSGIDEFMFFPHKKAIPRLTKQLTKRFLFYRKRGLYTKIIRNSSLMKKIEQIIKSKDLKNLSSEIWTNYLTSLCMTCYSYNFSLSDLKTVSRITIPIYRWRAMTYWLSVEKATAEEAEKYIVDQAFLLKNKLGAIIHD